jgi:hypothetical protein
MSQLRKFILVSILFSHVLLGAVAHAEEVLAGSVYNENEETEIIQRARRRIYPGGRDEGELAVQVQMTSPTRKINPQAEAAAEAHDD